MTKAFFLTSSHLLSRRYRKHSELCQ